MVRSKGKEGGELPPANRDLQKAEVRSEERDRKGEASLLRVTGNIGGERHQELLTRSQPYL